MAKQEELILIACINRHQWLSARDYTSNPGGWVPAAPVCGVCGHIYLYQVRDVDAMREERVLLEQVLKEVERARAMFPAPNACFGALVEEVGEVAKAAMYEPWVNVRVEAVQAIAMLVRLVTEGDCTLIEWRYKHVHDGNRNMASQDCMPESRANEVYRLLKRHGGS